jgi:hypothetical protein
VLDARDQGFGHFARTCRHSIFSDIEYASTDMGSIHWKHARWALPTATLLVIACAAMSQEKEEDDGDEVIKSINDVPAPVREAAVKYCGADIKKISKEKEDGELLYEFEFTSGGADSAAIFSSQGVLCEVEHTLAASALPKSMMEQIQKRYPGATVARAESTEVHGYELMIMVGGKKKALEASATGRLAGDEEADEEGEEDEGHEKGK